MEQGIVVHRNAWGNGSYSIAMVASTRGLLAMSQEQWWLTQAIVGVRREQSRDVSRVDVKRGLKEFSIYRLTTPKWSQAIKRLNNYSIKTQTTQPLRQNGQTH